METLTATISQAFSLSLGGVLGTVPEPAFELSYNGKSITADIAPFVASISYEDRMEGEADSLDVTLDDADNRWIKEWYPGKGASLSYRYGYRHKPLAPAGSFDIDEIEPSGPPDTVRIRALAAGVQRSVRTRQGRAYEKTTLEAIAKRIAKRNRMQLVGKFERVPIDRATQYQESDLSFLHRLSAQYGYAFKIVENNKRMVFWKTADLYGGNAIKNYGKSDLSGWHLRDKVADVPKAVTTRYHNRRRKKRVTATVSANQTDKSGKATSADTVKITRRAPTKASAEVQARAEMERRQLDRTGGEIRLEGDESVSAGTVIALKEDFGKLAGKYLVIRVRHTHTRNGGYTMTLELKRVPLPPPKGKKK
ncbi:MAG: phage protein D [Burkholderiaceae bacterium]|nr:phage protein D [Burkholderiaceae bacterium]